MPERQHLHSQPISCTSTTRQISNECRVVVLEQKLNNTYNFSNQLLALQALQTSGLPLAFQKQIHSVPNNKRLAILGDILLDWHLCRQWMLSNTSREVFSLSKSHVASNRNLDRVGRERGLHECIIRRTDAVQPIGMTSVATTVEAILGAVFLDAEEIEKGTGMDAVTKVASELGLDFTT